MRVKSEAAICCDLAWLGYVCVRKLFTKSLISKATIFNVLLISCYLLPLCCCKSNFKLKCLFGLIKEGYPIKIT